MIVASLLINILVLIPICLGLFINHQKMGPVFGPKTTAREILVCLYLTILVASVILLVHPDRSLLLVQGLLISQVTYKLLSVILIKDKKTPVLWFNLAIAIFHGATLVFTRA